MKFLESTGVKEFKQLDTKADLTVSILQCSASNPKLIAMLEGNEINQSSKPDSDMTQTLELFRQGILTNCD